MDGGEDTEENEFIKVENLNDFYDEKLKSLLNFLKIF